MVGVSLSPRVLRVLSIVVTLVVPVLLVLISVRLVMTETFLWLEYNRPDFPIDTYGFTQQDRLLWAPFALQYIAGPAGIDYLGSLNFPSGDPLYTTRELDHMVDVKKVFQVAMFVLVVCLIITALIVILMVRSAGSRAALRQGLFGGGLLTLAILAAVVLLLLTNWDTFFTDFHDLFFASGTWIFSYADTLIRLFPIPFWQDASLTIGGMSAGGAAAILAGCWWWRRVDLPRP